MEPWRMVCLRCETPGEPKKALTPLGTVCGVLALLGFAAIIAGLALGLLMVLAFGVVAMTAGRKHQCQTCKSFDLVTNDTPAARRILGE